MKTKSRHRASIFSLALILALAFSTLGVMLVRAEPDSTADVVYGQGGAFTTNTANKGGLSADSLSRPFGVAVDSSGNLYVVDLDNNRVLYYPAGSTTATRVYGQAGAFDTATNNKGGISADSLGGPIGVALDSSGNLYVADCYNHRVLYYPAGSTTATRVYGQAGAFTTNTANKGGLSANSLYYPFGVAVDSSGNLYVADCYNHRVLYYPAGSTTATRVYGQGGAFNTATQNKGGLSADSLYHPYGVALDSGGNLYVADQDNLRVLYYPVSSTTATRVYGQAGAFNTATNNKGGLSADSLAYPSGVAVDGSGNLYVADMSNQRVLYYPVGSTTAMGVYGQGGAFNTATLNKGGISADSLNRPYGVALDSDGNLYVADQDNHRVLEMVADSTAPSVSAFTLKTPATSPTNADTLIFLATFSEAVTGVDTADFAVNGITTATVTNVTQVTTSTYDVTVSGGNLAGFNGTVGLDLSGTPTITDLALNALPAGEPSADETYTVDNTTPSIASTGIVTNYTTHPSSFTVTFDGDMNNSGGGTGSEDVTNPANYLLVNIGINGTPDTISCFGGVVTDDTQVTISSVSYDSGTFTATVNFSPSLPNGSYRLFVCGTTSVADLALNKLNGGLSDTTYDFVVAAAGVGVNSSLPNTGFAPNRITSLSLQTSSYDDLGDLWLEIPRLGVKMPIVGVPQVDGDWDVSWLGNQAGWLNGSAFPTWEGNSVLTGHVYDAYGKAGPFVHLNWLWWGNKVVVHAWGGEYVYEVRSVQQVSPGNVSAMMKHEELPWLTLVTCRGYDEASDSYKYRVLVRAVLVEVK